MRGIAAALVVCIAVAGCTSWPDLRQAGSDEDLEERLPAPPPGAIDGLIVKVSVEPSNLWPIVVSVGPARSAPRNDARPWVQHELVFENTGDRPVRFADTRTSAFIGPSGHRRRLLAADEGCGYGWETRTSRIEARVCLLYLDEFEVRPHASVSRTVTLFKELRGMEPLTAGTYIFERAIRFRVGHEIPDEGTGRTAVLRLVYEIEAAGTY
jgi:hypothetical protein